MIPPRHTRRFSPTMAESTPTTTSVTVDVDALQHYYRIHGLDDRFATNAAWSVGVPRFAELFAELGIRATFFCVACDVENPANAARLRALVGAGHEIGNHTWHHPYDLSQAEISAEIRRQEIDEGRRRLEAIAETEIGGFRAPGYNVNAAVLRQVAESGHRYDSSVFPCAPYYAAKAAVLGLMRARGRTSHSVLGSPWVLAAPREPYRGSATNPHRPGDHGLPELPVTVVGGVPMIGTAFTALGRSLSVGAARLSARARRHVTVEFHAVDLLSMSDDGLDPALAVQPDLRVPVARKRRVFHGVLRALARRGPCLRLCDVATSLFGD